MCQTTLNRRSKNEVTLATAGSLRVPGEGRCNNRVDSCKSYPVILTEFYLQLEQDLSLSKWMSDTVVSRSLGETLAQMSLAVSLLVRLLHISASAFKINFVHVYIYIFVCFLGFFLPTSLNALEFANLSLL